MIKIGHFLFITVLSYACAIATEQINKEIVLDKLQHYINDGNTKSFNLTQTYIEKFDGSTFMEIQELVTDAVDCAFKPANTTTKNVNETSNRSRTSFFM